MLNPHRSRPWGAATAGLADCYLARPAPSHKELGPRLRVLPCQESVPVFELKHARFPWNLGKILRAYFNATVGGPLPDRWVELIKVLNEKERVQAPAKPEPSKER